LIILSSLFIISIKSESVKTINSKLVIAFTVAVLASSFNKAISQNISQSDNSAILFQFISTSTIQDFIIYDFQLDNSHSLKTTSQLLKVST
jgi:hypothetical protein